MDRVKTNFIFTRILFLKSILGNFLINFDYCVLLSLIHGVIMVDFDLLVM